MSNGAVCGPVLVVVPTGEVDEHDPPPPARARLPHALPVENVGRPDRPAEGYFPVWLHFLAGISNLTYAARPPSLR